MTYATALPPALVAPCCNTSRLNTLGVLQQLQRLLAHDATLADVAGLVVAMAQEYGCYAQLEQVIQSLVAEDLARQLSARRQAARSGGQAGAQGGYHSTARREAAARSGAGEGEAGVGELVAILSAHEGWHEGVQG